MATNHLAYLQMAQRLPELYATMLYSGKFFRLRCFALAAPLLLFGACDEQGSEPDVSSIQGLTDNAQGNSLFAHTEVDYKSVLPGLDIVRINPMITEGAHSVNALLSAHNSGWFWDFETFMSNPWNALVPTATLQHMGSITVLRSDNSPVAGGNAGNHARGLFYNLTFGKLGATAKLVDLQTDTTTIFQNTPHARTQTSWERLASRTFRDGTTINYTYEGGQPICQDIRIRHVASGASVYVKRTLHSLACLPTVITLPDGASRIVYSYTDSSTSGDPQLTKVTYPDGSFRTYTYRAAPNDASGLVDGISRLTKVVDQEGRLELGFVWDDALKRVKTRYRGSSEKPEVIFSVTDPAKGTFTDGEGVSRNVRVTSWRNSQGVQFTRMAGVSSPCSWCPNDAKDIKYNDIGLITQQTSQQGIVTNITRDANDPMQRESRRVVGAGTAEARTTTTEYDPRFNLPKRVVVQDASGSKIITETTYNAQGRPTKVRITNTAKTLAGDAATLVKETNIAYTMHQNGQVATMKVDGPRKDANDVVTYRYHSYGLLASVTDSLGTTTYENLDNLGRAQTIRHPNGTTTQKKFNWRGQLLESNTAGVVTRYTYYKNGLLKSETTPGTNEVTTYTYDAGNRLRTATDAAGNRKEMTYDKLGRLILARELNTQNGTVSRSFRTQYGNAGRTITTFPTDFPNQKNVRSLNADFQLTRIQDEMGKVTSLRVDALGRVTRRQNEASGLTHVSAFDVSDNVRSSTYTGGEGANRKQSFVYTSDADSSRWQSQDSDTGEDTYLRDLSGNVVDATNNHGGNRVKSSYDASNRVTRTEILDPTSGASLGIVNYRYDVNPDGRSPAPTGKLTQISGDFGSVKYFYDAKGNIVRKTQSHGFAEYSDRYTYDAAGRVGTITYPSGREVNIKRNAVGQPTEVYTRASANGSWQPVATNMTYAPFADEGDVRDMRLGGALRVTRLRDTAGRVTSYTDGNRTVSVQYRADGLISKLVSGGNTLASYTYDANNRLKSASGTFGSEQYVFESTGDLRSLTQGGTTSNLAYQENSSKLTSFAGSQVTHSHRGLVRSGGGLAVTYDAREFLATARVNGGPVTHYTYDALGKRQSKAVAGGATTNYHYDLQGRLIAEFNPATKQTLVEYIWIGDRPTMVIIPASGSNPEGRYVIYTDYSQTPVRVTDTAGTTVWQWNRNPFGSNAPSVALGAFNLRMPGQYYDAETGLHYNGARYYVPIAGRYLQPDPMGEAAGISAYTYANGDPVNYTDPTGLFFSLGQGGQTDLSGYSLSPTITVIATPLSDSVADGALAYVDRQFFDTSAWNVYGDDGYPGALTDFAPTSEQNNQVSQFLVREGVNLLLGNSLELRVDRVIDLVLGAAAKFYPVTRPLLYVNKGRVYLRNTLKAKREQEAKIDAVVQSAIRRQFPTAERTVLDQAVEKARADGIIDSTLGNEDAGILVIRETLSAGNAAVRMNGDRHEKLNLDSGIGLVFNGQKFEGFSKLSTL